MKVYDKSELEKNKVKDNQTEKKHINLTKKRKKEINGKRIFKISVFILIAAAVIYIFANAETIFEPLRGIASKIDNKTSYDVGFPIKLPGSTEYSFRNFGDNLSLLTDTYLYAYDTTGAQIYALRHGYSNPEQITNDKRVLIFDKSGYSFAVYSKTSLIYDKTIDDKIVFANISSGNLTTIVTDSNRYSNILYVYDDGGNWLYTKKFADENVMGAAFAGDNEHIIVVTIGVNRGELVTNFYKYSIKNTDGYVWKYTYTGNSIPCHIFADSERIITICDNIVLSVSSKTGKLIGSHSFTGILKDFAITSDLSVIHYNESSTNKNMLIALGDDAQALSVTNVSANAERVLIDNGSIYVLDGTHLRAYDSSLSITEEVTLESSDYNDFTKIGSRAYLLGYDTVTEQYIK